MERLRRILAMVTVLVIIGMVVAAVVMGIMGNQYTITMVLLIFRISLVFYAMFLFIRWVEKRRNSGNDTDASLIPKDRTEK